MSDESVAGTPRKTTNPDDTLHVRPVRGALPPEVEAMLVHAHALERDPAVGDRNAAFSLMRALLGGARRAGYSAPQLATCLGITVGTLHTRAYNDGWISETTFTEIAGIDLADVRRWRRSGKLPHRTEGEHGDTCYLASELISALAHPPLRRSRSAM